MKAVVGWGARLAKASIQKGKKKLRQCNHTENWIGGLCCPELRAVVTHRATGVAFLPSASILHLISCLRSIAGGRQAMQAVEGGPRGGGSEGVREGGG